ncbi:MAG: ABC transporter substrate-binding protein [Desulfobacterales bacterium]
MLSNKPRILSRIPALIAVICLILAGSAFNAAAEKVYKIGGIFSVTGPASFLGDPEKKSMEMAVEQINQNGGINGHKLEAVIYDTEGDPSKTVMSVSKLINKDGVIAIIGPSRTPTTLAVLPMVQKAKLPLISCAAGNKIVEPVKPWVFKTAQSDIQAVASIYQHMKAQGYKTIGIITVENAFGESGKEQLLEKASEYGIQIVRSETFGGKDSDMTSQLTKIRKEKPEAIVCWGTNPGPAVVAKNFQQLDIDIPLYQSHGVASPKFIELAGSAAEDILLPTGKILVADLLPDSDPQKDVLTQYIDTYESQYKGSVSGFGGYAYDAVHLLAKALDGSDGDREQIRRNLENIKDHVGVSGVFNFSQSDHNGLAPDAFVMVRIQNGAWELVK